jgi:imidazolonepropionase-like amidohydrolase
MIKIDITDRKFLEKPMKRLISSIVLLALSTVSQAETTVLECARLIDVEAGRILKNQQVLVEGDRIAAVGGQVNGRDSATHLSLDTCLPGLMDMHVHLDHQMAKGAYINRFQYNEADWALLAAHYANITLQSGFTTVRNLGDSNNVTIALRKAIDAGVASGPRIYTAGKSLATTGGHADPTNGYREDLMGDPGPERGVVNGVESARKAVRQRYKDGSDLIKITATGGVLSLAKSGENPQFSDEELEAIIQTANDYEFHVAAHAHGAEGMKRAVIAGVRSIEHGTYYVPTILAGRFVAEKSEIDDYFPDVVRPKAAAVGPQIQDTFARAYAAGVAIAFGTDSGVSAHGDNALEFVFMVEGGMPEMEAIQSATMTAAALLGIGAELGSISEGKLADIIAVTGDPVEDIGVLQDVRFVMKGGEIHKNE